jgi:hypothetical protein
MTGVLVQADVIEKFPLFIQSQRYEEPQKGGAK